MEYSIRPVTEKDRSPVIDIFNHYIENSLAAFPENKVGYEFFDLLRGMAKGYPFYVVEAGPGDKDAEDGSIIGYGLLRPHNMMSTFKRSAELTYFLKPGNDRKGIGTRMLNMLVDDARKMGVDTLLASTSSVNQASIDFHKKHGFVECGRFLRVGKKLDKDLDIVWLQRFI
ncbi:GNAT family N-acetyltransferase [Methanocella sp. CWC-04]|uniref:GNAT family N-acetyltransferase n=1 Tax=Methanooceanicella nereidis TaxID=2052831 RepID=A0AAP2W5I4_9EURY|nr:GNAT family N-acetyltransferase [Methanocella sp. CWC-04]MCD1294343.1 GNAT family N-acetyltransferase [Methanocella sp. CWC-04]